MRAEKGMWAARCKRHRDEALSFYMVQRYSWEPCFRGEGGVPSLSSDQRWPLAYKSVFLGQLGQPRALQSSASITTCPKSLGITKAFQSIVLFFIFLQRQKTQVKVCRGSCKKLQEVQYTSPEDHMVVFWEAFCIWVGWEIDANSNPICSLSEWVEVLIN